MSPILHMFLPHPQLWIRIPFRQRDVHIPRHDSLPTLGFVPGDVIFQFRVEDAFPHVSITDDFPTPRISIGVCGAIDGIDVKNHDAKIRKFSQQNAAFEIPVHGPGSR